MQILMAERSDLYHDARVQKEAITLIKAGFKVRVLGVREEKENRDNTFLFRLQTVWLIPRKYKLLRKLHLIFIIIFMNILLIFIKADFYHAHNTMFLFGMWISSRIHKGKFIYDSHEVQWEQTVIESKLEKLFILKTDSIINVSKGRAKEQAKRYGIDESKITLISNYPYIADSIKPEIKGKTADIRFIYSGGFNLASNKLDNFIRAIAKHKNIYFDLMAFGYGNDSDKISCLINNLGIEERVRFKPLVKPDEVVEEISNYDFAVNMLINPYNLVYLNYPSINKIYEYLAAGLPIFCSNLPAFEEEIVSQGIGISVNPIELESIEKGVEKIIAMSNEEFISIKKKAYETAIAYYNWSSQEAKLISLYS